SVGVSAPPPLPSPLPSASPSAIPISPAPVARRALTSSDRAPPPDPVQMAAHRAALASLVERVSTTTDMAALDGGAPANESVTATVDRTLADRIAALRAEGQLPSDIDPDGLAAEARRELLELGPIGPMLRDEDTTEV